MNPTFTKEQSGKWARSICRDAPWLTPAWPTPEQTEAFMQTELGQQIAKCFEEMDKRRNA